MDYPGLKNKVIFCDRYIDSTFAYQGSGRTLDKKAIEELFNAFNFPVPDLTILLDVPVQVGLQRARKRDELDRFEKEDLNFHENIRRAYLDLAKKNSERIVLFDSLISEGICISHADGMSTFCSSIFSNPTNLSPP